MRTGTSHIILASPDTGGILAGAALRRRLGTDQDIQLLSSRELSRRVFGLAEEHDPQRLVVADLVPSDSVRSLLVPSLSKLNDAGARALWFYGRARPAPVLAALQDLIDLTYEEGAQAWCLITRDQDDDELDTFIRSIAEATTEEGRSWRLVLRAIVTSWDWARYYAAIARLADLRSPRDEDLEWSRQQLAEADRAASVVTMAPVRAWEGLRVAVVTDPTVAARVRPDVLRRVRVEVDAVAFVTGPHKLTILTTGRDKLLPSTGSGMEGGLVHDAWRHRADVVWPRDKVPSMVSELLGRDLVIALRESPGATKTARVSHSRQDRIGKGLHPQRLAASDRSFVERLPKDRQ